MSIKCICHADASMVPYACIILLGIWCHARTINMFLTVITADIRTTPCWHQRDPILTSAWLHADISTSCSHHDTSAVITVKTYWWCQPGIIFNVICDSMAPCLHQHGICISYSYADLSKIFKIAVIPCKMYLTYASGYLCEVPSMHKPGLIQWYKYVLCGISPGLFV